MATWLSVKITEAKTEYHHYRLNFWDVQSDLVPHLVQIPEPCSEKSTRYIQGCLGSPDWLEHRICKRIRKKLYTLKARIRMMWKAY